MEKLQEVEKMNKKIKLACVILLSLGAIALVMFFVDSSKIAVLNPKGLIAFKERNLLVIATLLMLIVVIPVFILASIFAWKYRASNTKAKYSPNWDYNLVAESIWWGIPCAIILVLSIMTWKSSRELDPFKPLESTVKPIHIQVVALQWKWLFIYPEQNIATVNFVQFPENTPLNFEITADAPMNSFWIPELGSQIYAMAGMRSKLHLIAHDTGSFRGASANLSGQGFAGMEFIAKASSEADFNQWVESVKKSTQSLSLNEYQELVKPSEYNPAAFYILKEENLYDQIVMKYMMPMTPK